MSSERVARADLLALTEDGLVQLGNAGLVKRAARDIAAGNGPDLDEAEDGTIAARFPDGTLTRLPPGRAPAEATCTCPAGGICRHRVALVLAYQRREGGAPPAAEWDPGTLDPDAYEAALGPSARKELAKLLAARLDVRLERGAVPSARLPMASVRFLVPNDPTYARCDCAAGGPCAHIALALRAFRAAEGASGVTLGAQAAVLAEDIDLAGAVDALLARLLMVGIVAGASAHAGGLDRLRRAAEAVGAVQILLALDALAEQIAAYEGRSARYDELECLALATELHARVRAPDAGSALGLGEAMETAMGKTRLASLGARARAQGTDIAVAVLLADTDTGSTMLLEKRFVPSPSEAGRLARTIPTRQMAQGLPVAGTARGQILTSVGRRRADGLLGLGSGSGGRTVLMPRDPRQAFPPPLHVSDPAALLERFAERPPAFLRPRNRVGDVHVFAVEAVLGQAWGVGAQLWQAAVSLPANGGTLFLERAYDAGAPGALDILFAAAEGRFGAVHRVAGPVRVEGGALVCDPWSLGADRFVVPDLDAVEGQAPPPLSDLSGAITPLEEARRLLAGAVHAGSRARVQARGSRLPATLRAAGYRTTAERLSDWLAAEADPVPAFGRACVWVAALLEG